MSRHWMPAAALAVLVPGLACAATPAARPTATPAAVPSARPTSEAEVPRVDVPQLKQAFDAKAVAIVDTRSEQAFGMGHIPGAVVWDSDPAQFDAQVARLKASKKAIVTYCT